MAKRIAYLIIAAALALYAGAASAQSLTLSQISGYLNQMETAKGSFTQINSDGSLATGQIYIKRPGRIRFEYNPPARSLVLASAGTVAIFDPRSNTGPEQYPLSRTPLSILLRRNVDLENENMVRNIVSDGETTTVTALDPENPDYGSIQLVFSADPIMLRQWIVTDDLGTQTTTVLNDLEVGTPINSVLFNIQQEISKQGN
ncbi:outer membrane lipoprotein carrier protein LolA [Yoonia sp.]|uniref:LolA family protein n=1 Tax=Yoonia sp. TaxID=2212373 RepID=UPI0023B74953